MEHTHAGTQRHKQIVNAIHSIKNDTTSHVWMHTSLTKFLHQPPLASIDRAFACIILCFVTSSRPEYIIVIDHCWETNRLIHFVKCVLFILTLVNLCKYISKCRVDVWLMHTMGRFLSILFNPTLMMAVKVRRVMLESGLILHTHKHTHTSAKIRLLAS